MGMQNGFCHPDRGLFAPGSESAIRPVTGLVAVTRDTGVRIICTCDVHPPERFEGNHYYSKLKRWGEHIIKEMRDVAFHDGLNVHDEDLVVRKRIYDTFYRARLAGWLDSHGMNDLFIYNILASACVLHTARSASLRDYRSILVTDMLGCIEEEHKACAVNHINWLLDETATLVDATFG